MTDAHASEPRDITTTASAVAAIVLAAGEGTRMRSAVPKVLHPLAGRPLVEHAVRAAAELQPRYLAVVTGHGRDAVAEHLARLATSLDRDIVSCVQQHQRGTGHAVACALPMLPDGYDTVLVTYGDVPLLGGDTLAALLAEHRQRGNAVTVLSAVVEDPAGYGRMVRDPEGTLTSIVEHRDAAPDELAIHEVNSGVYAFDAPVLAAALQRLSTDNAQGELYLTDVLTIARSGGGRVSALVVDDPWLVEGVNDRVQLARIGAEYNRRRTEHWMRAGVTMIDPATTWLDAEVRLGRDVVLEPGVQLRGATTVGDGAVIGPDTTLTDVTVGDQARVVRTHGEQSVIGAGAIVGPFTHLRPGTQLGSGGKIGAFAETKNAQIGTGSKVPHLAYVGDATIGEHANIGCGVITVNYDGVRKHRTTVGSHCRIGSDTMLVAPVTVGDGAYSGAGTVIRQDVPPGALAVSGGQQRNIEGWVTRRRPGTAAAQAAARVREPGSTAQPTEADDAADPATPHDGKGPTS